MALGIDAQVLAELAPLLEAVGETEGPPIGDVETRRVRGHRMFDYVASTWAPVAGVEVDRHTLMTADGATLDLDWYQRPDGQPGSAVLYLHGGGMIFGLEHLGRVYDLAVRDYVATSGVPMLVVDYRIAPEHPHPTPVEDCYAALRWLADNAATLGVDPGRIGVMGDSAGGGLAAGVCLLARDRGGPPVAQQLLVYPMLDDRIHPPDPELLPFLTWTYDDNVTGWAALLGDSAGTRHGTALCRARPRQGPGRATGSLSRRRRPRHLPRRGHHLCATAGGCRGADRAAPAPGMPARVRGAGPQGGRFAASNQRSHAPPAHPLATAKS